MCTNLILGVKLKVEKWQVHFFLYLTSELQPSELEGDQTVADFDEMHQSVQVVGGQDETIPRAEVAPSAQEEVSTQAVLQ